jgi:hypothetical protein
MAFIVLHWRGALEWCICMCEKVFLALFFFILLLLEKDKSSTCLEWIGLEWNALHEEYDYHDCIGYH